MNENQAKNNYLQQVCNDLQMAKNIDVQDLSVIGSLVIEGMPPKTFCVGMCDKAFIGIASQINLLSKYAGISTNETIKQIKEILNWRN